MNGTFRLGLLVLPLAGCSAGLPRNPRGGVPGVNGDRGQYDAGFGQLFVYAFRLRGHWHEGGAIPTDYDGGVT